MSLGCIMDWVMPPNQLFPGETLGCTMGWVMPPNCLFPGETSTCLPRNTWFHDSSSPHHKRHHDLFNRFSTAPTDTHTDRSRSNSNKRPHFMMRRNNKKKQGPDLQNIFATILRLSYDNTKVTSKLQNVLRRTLDFSSVRFTCNKIQTSKDKSEIVFVN